MWYPVIRCILIIRPHIFEEITLIAPNYRGLLERDVDTKRNNFEVNMNILVDDCLVILKHAKVKELHCLIGWSLGADVCVHLLKKDPKICKKLFLLNPSSGKTLHTVFQPFFPLPSFIGASFSSITHTLRDVLYVVSRSSIWPVLRDIVNTSAFHIIFILSAFLGGYPPEQPSYFTAYCEDIFYSRFHTQHLLDLIITLDEASPYREVVYPRETVVVSGLPDILTAVYHGDEIAKYAGVRNQVFTMGSHFLLIEWPQDIAQMIVNLIYS